MEIVWIVELREEKWGYDDTVVMHVASSRKKAEAWIKLHSDAHEGDDWHWWIGSDLVDDAGEVWDHDWMTYDRYGVQRGL